MKLVLTQLLILSSILLAGCASQSPFDMAQQGPTMKDNYERHMSGVETGTSEPGSSMNGAININRGLERDINYQAVEERAYGRLQNPEMEMFIYARRSTRHGVIIPSYSVRFPMYERVQYGLVRDVAHVE